jgi:hypothetical protein
MERIGQWFRLRPEETGVALVMSFLLLSNSLAQQVSEITAISNFLSTGGVNQLLLVWMVDAVIVVLTTGLQSLIIDRFNRLTLIGALTFILALCFVVVRFLFALAVPANLNYALLYLLSQQQWLFFPLVFWILANDIFDMAQATRLFPLIASGAFVGRLMGIGIAAITPEVMSTQPGFRSEDLLVLNALIYLLAYALILGGLRSVRLRSTAQHRGETVRETLTEGLGFVREVPAFRHLAFAIMALLVCETVLEFRFLAVSNAAFQDPGQYQTFYSFYRLGLTLASFLIQTFFTSRLIARLNLKHAFLILPVSALLGSLWMTFRSNIVSAVGGVVLHKLPLVTIDESSRKAFQALVPEERRGRVSIFMDSYLPALGTILGCLLTGAVVLAAAWLSPTAATPVYAVILVTGAVISVWTMLERWQVLVTVLIMLTAGALILFGVRVSAEQAFYVYLGVALMATAAAIWAIFKMRAVYETSLLNWRLKRRQRGARVLDKLEF